MRIWHVQLLYRQPSSQSLYVYDSEYKRTGISNLFMIFELLGGKRHVKVTEQRTKKDWAECMKMVVDELYPEAKKITIVMDNLNTHTPASLYGIFSPEEARRITEKLDIQYTPKQRKLA